MGASIGSGTSLYFQTSGFECVITKAEWQGIGERESVRLTQFDDSWEEFFPKDTINNGTLKLKILYDPVDGVPPFAGVPETVELRIQGIYRWSATMHMIGWTWGVPLEQLMEAEMTLKVSGEIAIDTLTTILNPDNDVVLNADGEECYVGI